mgnify:CR=1 FL=1
MSSFLMRYSILYELNTLDACWIAVDVWSNSSRCRIFGLLDKDVMPIFMIIALDIIIIMHFSINCSAVLCSPTVIVSILRETSSEICGPRVYFSSYKFPIYNFSFWFTFFAIFYFPFHNQKYQKYYFIVYPSISDLMLQITVKGLTAPLSRRVQVVVCLCRYLVACSVVSYWIDTLVLKNGGKYLLYFAASPFPLQGKNQCKLKR